jgi:hypothetical protein
MRLFVWLPLAGALLGAIPAAVMEFLTPLWEPAVITAFGMPMIAGAGFGYLVALIRQ